MSIIDFEAHFALERTSALKVIAIKGSESSLPHDMLKNGPFINLDIVGRMEERLRLMDESGVDMQIISHQVGIEAAEPEQSIKFARYSNDMLAEVITREPNRFKGWAALPMKAPEVAAAELERCIRELGFFGWNVYSNFGAGPRLDDVSFRPVVQKASELGCPIYLHPTAPCMNEFTGMGSTLWGALGYTVDVQITLLRLILSGVLDEFPNLRLILGHLGEAFPFFLKRMSGGRLEAKNRHSVDYYFQHNIWVSTSGNFEPSSFACTKAVLGIDRVLFGTDFPMGNISRSVDFINGLPLSEEEREKVFCENAAQFGLSV